MNDYDDAENAIAGPSGMYQARMARNGHDTGDGVGKIAIPDRQHQGQTTSDPLSRSYERLNGGPLSSPIDPSSTTTLYSRDPTLRGDIDIPPEPPFIVRAKFDFNASDSSALSFQTGDVIEVITMLESGWWDGMLGNARGWFPSNFVEIIGEEGDEGDEGEEEPELGHGSRATGINRNEQDQQAPTRRANVVAGRPNTVLAEDVLSGDTLGEPWQGGEESLEELARSLGVGAEDLAEVDEFALAARRQRQRADTLNSARPNTSSPGRQNLAGRPALFQADLPEEDDEEDFNTALQSAAAQRREREGTAGTVRMGTAPFAGQTPLALGRAGRSDNTPRAQKRQSAVSSMRSAGPGEGYDDAWIPCLTPDGQVSTAGL